MFTWLAENWEGIALVFFILYSILSEVLGMNPKWKANAVIQLIFNIIKRLCGRNIKENE